MSAETFTKLNELAQALPAEYSANAVALVEKMQSVVSGIGDRDREWRPGILRVIQPTTTSIPDGAKIGSMVLGDSILGDSAPVLPLRLWESRQYWDPNPSNTQMLCSSPDAKIGNQFGQCKACPHSVFKEGSGSDCNKAKTFMVVTSDLSEVFMVNFSKGGYANGMAWEKLLRTAGVQPYRRTYALKTQPNPKAKQVRNIVAEPSNPSRTPDVILPFLDALFEKISSDRNAYLEKFYEYAATKHPSTQPTIGHDTEERVVDVKDVESSPAGKYQL